MTTSDRPRLWLDTVPDEQPPYVCRLYLGTSVEHLSRPIGYAAAQKMADALLVAADAAERCQVEVIAAPEIDEAGIQAVIASVSRPEEDLARIQRCWDLPFRSLIPAIRHDDKQAAVVIGEGGRLASLTPAEARELAAELRALPSVG